MTERTPVDVAVGVLIDGGQRFLLTSRPEGKVYAGYWEFPGGKLEQGETVEAALRRELHEELGIAIGALRGEALVWALERGSRSGRVAWQFARDRAGRLGEGAHA